MDTPNDNIVPAAEGASEPVAPVETTATDTAVATGDAGTANPETQPDVQPTPAE